jgi:hypothetical protein
MRSDCIVLLILVELLIINVLNFLFLINFRYNCSFKQSVLKKVFGGRRGRDRMVVGFTTTYVISAYHH